MKKPRKRKSLVEEVVQPVPNSFPEKTVQELEIIKLVNKVRKQGSEESFIKIRSYVDSYIKLFTKKYRIAGCDADEIEQECLVALRFKAIKDFDQKRGAFISFAILCIKRHLFSLIKGNNQLKRRVLNTSISLDENRSDDGDFISLNNVVEKHTMAVDDILSKEEDMNLEKTKLLQGLSKLEQEVLKCYLRQLKYDEIVKELKVIYTNKKITKKTIDNSLQRIRQKAQIDLPKMQ
jgi:RNA polymerase sporulation-specific sigma factor